MTSYENRAHWSELLEDLSVEMTGGDIGELADAAALLPASTRVNVTFLASEDLSLRLDAARAVRDAGLIPAPTSPPAASATRVSSRRSSPRSPRIGSPSGSS